MSLETVTRHFRCPDCRRYFDLRIPAFGNGEVRFDFRKVHCPFCKSPTPEAYQSDLHELKRSEKTREIETGKKPVIQPVNANFVLFHCSGCGLVFIDAKTRCPFCPLLVAAETGEESEERKAFAKKYEDLPTGSVDIGKDQLISFDCCSCGRQFHLSRTLDFHDSFIISCPLCRTRQPETSKDKDTELRQPEKTRETETDFGPPLRVKSETLKPSVVTVPPDATKKDFVQYRLREISFHLYELLSLLFNLSGEKP